MRATLAWVACGAWLTGCAVVAPPEPGAPVAVGEAEARAAVVRATEHTKVAGAYGLDQTSWDLVRIAQEDIAAALTSIDDEEYPEAVRLADGASASLRQEIRRAFDASYAKVEKALDMARQADDADEDRVTAAEYHLALAEAAAAEGEPLKAREYLDAAAATLARTAAATR